MIKWDHLIYFYFTLNCKILIFSHPVINLLRLF
nr:MAG TPA: hypothetical protein [Caudoviricetes sp.]